MNDSPFHPQLKGLLIAAACLLLAVYLGYMIGTEDYWPLVLGAVFTGVLVLFFFSGRFFWVLTIASSFLAGTFPILGAAFTPFQLLMAMGLIKFAIEDVILGRVRITLPSRFDMLMIAGFMSVITIHAIHDRFGLRFLGSDIWGGKNYVNVFVGFAAFFVIQSIPMRPGLWAKFPYVVLAVSAFDLLIGIITTISPNSIYAIYPFYSAVSNTGLQEVTGSSLDVTGRIGAFGSFGFIVATIIFAGVSLRKILHPSNFFRVLALISGGVFVLFSGFRTWVLNTFLLVVIAGLRDLKAAAVALLPVIAAIFFVLSVFNSEIVRLPKQVQRGLAFLPGNWDVDMTLDAQASNDFRMNVWGLWWKQYFPQQPILGRGFGFQSQWSKKSIYYGDAADIQQMVETGNIHNGFFATLDAVGIVGTVFFVLWNLSLFVRTMRIPFDQRGGDYLAVRFLALFLAVTITSYWMGATTIGSFLPGEFALAGLLLRMQKDLRPEEAKTRGAAPATQRGFRRQLVPV